MEQYTLIRSRRRSVAMQISPQGELIVRAPLRLPAREIDRLVREKADLIEAHRRRWQERQALRPPEPTEAERKALIARAKAELPPLLERYAARMGVRPRGMRVTSARTRWGSCSSKGTVCFSWRLMRMPEEFVEYVVVHELAHLREMNHGPRFWAVVASVLPDWRARRALGRNA